MFSKSLAFPSLPVSLGRSVAVFVCAHVYDCVCVCVCVRERESVCVRARVRVRAIMCVCV